MDKDGIKSAAEVRKAKVKPEKARATTTTGRAKTINANDNRISKLTPSPNQMTNQIPATVMVGKRTLRPPSMCCSAR